MSIPNKKYEGLQLHRIRSSTGFAFLGKQMNYLQANHSFVFYGSRQIREKCFSAPVSLPPLIFLISPYALMRKSWLKKIKNQNRGQALLCILFSSRKKLH
jgi:hypothetical protein